MVSACFSENDGVEKITSACHCIPLMIMCTMTDQIRYNLLGSGNCTSSSPTCKSHTNCVAVSCSCTTQTGQTNPVNCSSCSLLASAKEQNAASSKDGFSQESSIGDVESATTDVSCPCLVRGNLSGNLAHS